jgi:type IV secretory pathway VirB10-like protein
MNENTPELDPKNLTTPRQPLGATRRFNPFVIRIEALFAIVVLGCALGAFIFAPMLTRHNDQQARVAADVGASPLPIPDTGVNAPVGDAILNATPLPLPSGGATIGSAPVNTAGAPTGDGTSTNAFGMNRPLAEQVAIAQHDINAGNPNPVVAPLPQDTTTPAQTQAVMPPVPEPSGLGGITLGSGSTLGSGQTDAAPAAVATPVNPNSNVIITGNETINAKRAAFASGTNSSPYLSSKIEDPISRYEVFAGTPLRMQLDDRIDTSSAPCIVTAHLEYDVHASLRPYPIVIPSATRVIGRCNPNVTNGDSRVEVVWDTMTYPDGQTFDLQGAPASDASGASGLGANVDNHIGNLITTTLLTAVLGAGAQLAQPPATTVLTSPTLGQQAAGSVGNSVIQTGNQLIQQQIQRVPTLTVERGRQFIVRLRQTLVLDPTGYTDPESGAAG